MVSYTALMSLAAAMASIAMAVPVEIEERQVGVFDANYDNLATPTIISLTSIGVYDGLNYTGLALASNRISAIPGLPPHSPNNDIFYSTISELTPLGGPPQITIPTNTLGLFTASSIYFGCTISVPVPCSFTVTGSVAGRQTAQQTFQFNPRGDPAPLQQAILTQPGFASIDKIQFATTYSLLGISTPGVTVLDDFVYTLLAV